MARRRGTRSVGGVGRKRPAAVPTGGGPPHARHPGHARRRPGRSSRRSSAGSSATSARRSTPRSSSSATGSASTGRWPTASQSTPPRSPRRTGTARALRARVAQRPGGRRLRRVRRRTPHVPRCRPSRRRCWPTRRSPAFACRRVPARARRHQRTSDKLASAFRTGGGVGWHEHHHDLFERHRALLPPGLRRAPRRDVDPGARRRRGEARARAPASPTSAAATAPRRSSWPRRIPRVDVRRLRLPRGVDRGGARAARRGAGVADRVRFEVAPAKDFPATGYDLVGDLRLPARHGRPGRRRPRTCARRSPPTAPG